MPNKRGPLSKAEVFYIEQHVKAGKSSEEIASDLDRNVKSIESCVEKAQKENPPKRFIAGDQFARTKGSVIMTENASTMADATRKKKSPKTLDCVTKIKNEQTQS